jgi:putative ABC transport system ATP-binding protein
VDVLRGVNLSVHPGDTVAVLGQSGSGKSTLLALLAGLDRPTSGAVRLDGTNLNDLDEAALARVRARRIGIIFQQFHLMSRLTALENVRLPLELQAAPAAHARAVEMLASVGLADRARHFPDQLSGGERQRVAIARALAIHPSILLADEPSGNLDQKTGAQVMAVLFDLVRAQNATLLMVTHNDELARRCARRVALIDGQLHEQG